MPKQGKTPKKKSKEKSPQKSGESEYPAMDQEELNRLVQNAIEQSQAQLQQKHEEQIKRLEADLREGRRLKTKFRLGCHDLRSSSCRMQLVRNAQCPCCESRESETIQHTWFGCEAFEEEREAFLARLYSVCPPARQLTDEGRCRLVMGDELPREIENPL